MAYITKDQLNLYLQKINGQSTGPGATGTTRSRPTLTGPRPPTFGSRTTSQKIFQDGLSSVTTTTAKAYTPITPTTPQLESAVKSLSLSSLPSTPVAHQRPSSPILESMGDSGAQEVVMESMGSEEYETEDIYTQQHYGAFLGQHGHGPAGQTWHATGYGNQAAPLHYYNNYHDNGQQQHSMHLSQEQYLQLQQQQQQQQQGYLRQQHSAHAAVHGYIPALPPSSAHIQGHESAHLHHPKPTSPSASKTITPRIVPVVEIPKYTIFNHPPKSEINNDEGKDDDDNWAPEPPPRDTSKGSEIKPTAPSPPPSQAPIESLESAGSFTSRTNIFQITESRTTGSSRSSFSSMSSSHSHTSDTNEALVPAATSVEEERIPMPPPREFRRKSAATTPPPSTLHSAVSNGVFSVGSSIFKPGSPNGRTQSTNSSSSSLNRISGIPALGTVRANSAKFNNLIAAGAVDTPNPKAFAPKIKNTVTSSTNATANGTPTANPWTSRKVVDVLRRNSLSKGTGMMARKSTDVRSDLPATDWKSIPAPLEVDVDKELPPIRSITPHSHLTTEFNAPGTLGKVRDDVEHESKCIVSDEERIRSPSTLPVAADTSKEILVEPEGKSLTVAETQVTPPPREPARDNEAGLRSGHQSGFVCSSCDEPISGMMITAMGKRWHSDHFVCTVCNLNLEHVQFFQKDGLPYCHLDYHEKFSPKCGHCNTAIENECLTALGKSWHPGHFFCRECGDPFEEDGYMVHDDQPYCEKDYLRLFAPKCTGCQDPIQGDFINALKGKWHRDCFGCTVCHIGFDTSSYYVENGKPYCQVHYKNGAKSTST